MFIKKIATNTSILKIERSEIFAIKIIGKTIAPPGENTQCKITFKLGII
jgi:hypothetical protein